MNIRNFFLFGLFLAFLLALSGCQGNNSDTPISSTTVIPDINSSDTRKSVVLPLSNATLTLNGEAVQISVRVFDNTNIPSSEGNVKIAYPDDAVTGRDVGSFDKLSSTVINGVASFIYTAPAKLDLNTSDIKFGFYHDSDVSNIKTYTFTISPESNQTVSNSYELYSSLDSGSVSMNLNANKSISFRLNNDSNQSLPDKDIASINIVSLNPNIATLEDVTTGTAGNNITISNKNSITINARSNTLSGVVPLHVTAEFRDSNGDTKSVDKVFNIVILSGPPSAMSLSYASTEQVPERAKYIEKWVVTVTDRYNNLVNTNPVVSMGMMAGYAQSSALAANPANNLYFLPSVGNGALSSIANDFTTTASAFANVDSSNEYLVLFGNGYTYNASGKWDIDSVTGTVLGLVDDYKGDNTSGLGFAVGNNYRQDACREGEEWIGNVYPAEQNNYTVNSTGSMVIDVEYDYYLTAKDVMLWVNLTGAQHSDESTVRIGEAKKITLRGTGLTSETYSFSSGFSGVVRLHVTLNGTTEFLRNANFGYSVDVASDDANWSVSDDSMAHGITYCNGQSGISYVDINFTSPAPNAGTVTLVNVLPATEF
ncbi:MAG: hypothetical protein Q7S59_01885 [Sulfurimonas sp.]|nr:hypothetical protein [Sulfurimonas sp.]